MLPGPEMRLREGGSYREPDLAFVVTANAARITADGIDGPADLVVELVSDDSGRRDRKQKYDEYESAGVREYWVVDPRPLRQAFYVYVLGGEGRFEQTRPEDDGRVHSTVIPGLWINPAWLWQEPTPKVTQVLELIAEQP